VLDYHEALKVKNEPLLSHKARHFFHFIFLAYFVRFIVPAHVTLNVALNMASPSFCSKSPIDPRREEFSTCFTEPQTVVEGWCEVDGMSFDFLTPNSCETHQVSVPFHRRRAGFLPSFSSSSKNSPTQFDQSSPSPSLSPQCNSHNNTRNSHKRKANEVSDANAIKVVRTFAQVDAWMKWSVITLAKVVFGCLGLLIILDSSVLTRSTFGERALDFLNFFRNSKMESSQIHTNILFGIDNGFVFHCSGRSPAYWNSPQQSFAQALDWALMASPRCID
jgi:hypothetical protein